MHWIRRDATGRFLLGCAATRRRAARSGWADRTDLTRRAPLESSDKRHDFGAPSPARASPARVASRQSSATTTSGRFACSMLRLNAPTHCLLPDLLREVNRRAQQLSDSARRASAGPLRFPDPSARTTGQQMRPSRRSAAGGHNTAVVHTFKMSFLRVGPVRIQGSASRVFCALEPCRKRQRRAFSARAFNTEKIMLCRSRAGAAGQAPTSPVAGPATQSCGFGRCSSAEGTPGDMSA